MRCLSGRSVLTWLEFVSAPVGQREGHSSNEKTCHGEKEAGDENEEAGWQHRGGVHLGQGRNA